MMTTSRSKANSHLESFASFRISLFITKGLSLSDAAVKNHLLRRAGGREAVASRERQKTGSCRILTFLRAMAPIYIRT